MTISQAGCAGTCVICMTEYADRDERPYIECHDNVCPQCLARLVQDGTPCPTCRGKMWVFNMESLPQAAAAPEEDPADAALADEYAALDAAAAGSTTQWQDWEDIVQRQGFAEHGDTQDDGDSETSDPTYSPDAPRRIRRRRRKRATQPRVDSPAATDKPTEPLSRGDINKSSDHASLDEEAALMNGSSMALDVLTGSLTTPQDSVLADDMPSPASGLVIDLTRSTYGPGELPPGSGSREDPIDLTFSGHPKRCRLYSHPFRATTQLDDSVPGVTDLTEGSFPEWVAWAPLAM